MFDFGLRLRELRKNKNLSQDELARKINKSKSVVSGYENNIKTPPIDVLTSLALIYGVSLDYLSGIEKKEMLSVDKLSESQKKLINLLIEEFKAPRTEAAYKSFSPRQQKIMNDLIAEFFSK